MEELLFCFLRFRPMKLCWSRSMLLGMRMFLSVTKYSAYFALMFDLLRLRVDSLLDLRRGSGSGGGICFDYSSAVTFASFFYLSWSRSYICMLKISSSSESMLMTWFSLVFLTLVAATGCCWTTGLKSLTKAKAFLEVLSNCFFPNIFYYSPIICARLGVTLGYSGPTISKLFWAFLHISKP